MLDFVIAIAWPLAIAVLGAGLWAFGKRPKLEEAGRLLFFSGVLVVTMQLAGHTLHIG